MIINEFILECQGLDIVKSMESCDHDGYKKSSHIFKIYIKSYNVITLLYRLFV